MVISADKTMSLLSDLHSKTFTTCDSWSVDFQSHLCRYPGTWELQPCTLKQSAAISWDSVSSFLASVSSSAEKLGSVLAKSGMWFSAKKCPSQVIYSFRNVVNTLCLKICYRYFNQWGKKQWTCKNARSLLKQDKWGTYWRPQWCKI